jgi:hypothetical protein
MNDLALDSFINRFGQIEAPQQPLRADSTLAIGANGIGQKQSSPLAIGANGVGATATGKIGEIGPGTGNQIGANGVMAGGESFSGSEGGGMGAIDVAGAVQGAAGLVETFSGSGLDDSGIGNGPGKATGHILKGAGQGAALGSAIGTAIPGVGNVIGGAAGAVVGSVGGVISHSAAQKRFFQNKKDYNLKVNDADQKEIREDYRMSRGLAAIGESKALLQKQLNIIS